MRNLLAFLAALVLAVVGVGWYLGWYQVFVTPGRGGHEAVKIDINTDKVSKDIKAGEEKLLHDGKEKLGNRMDTGKAGGAAKKDGNEPSSLLQPPAGVLEEQEMPPPRPFASGGGPADPDFTRPSKQPVPPLPTPFGTSSAK
jgi:hypothetical protein